MKYMRRIFALSCALLMLLSSHSAVYASGMYGWTTGKPASSDVEYEIVGDSALAQEVLDILNTDRARAGLSALELDARLCEAAQIRLNEIVQQFSHTRPDGTKFATVCEGAYAENIARGQRSAVRVMAARMSSDGHRANILNPRYATVGICACEVNGIMYWVQLFGK